MNCLLGAFDESENDKSAEYVVPISLTPSSISD